MERLPECVLAGVGAQGLRNFVAAVDVTGIVDSRNP